MTLSRRSPPLDRSLAADLPPAPPFVQRWRWARRTVLAALWTAGCAPIQAALLALSTRGKRLFPRVYWSGVCRIFGIERRIVGQRAAGSRPVLFAANHTSWLDVPVLGGTVDAAFVAKADVAGWPVINLIARLGRTVYVTRRAGNTGRERDDIRARLRAGDSLVLFPEGTSSDGARVMPFRSPFFAVVDGADAALIQPVSVVYDRLDYLPARRSSRPVSSWYGDMELGSHFWRLARHRHLRATILFHPPVDPADYPSRKALAASVWAVVSTANAALRQGRPPEGAATSLSLDTTAPHIGTVNPP